ncbi:NAD(P)-binding protein [Suhomyces tanzawaensis NRRL Y-17324]|uniref:NAD(P)-binding protein n=1 Tax=Suhomyces tanzawaensis NRRL Y-17324 TaxID=984487 RepID=A0A1E4SJX0_9ASCO|nr:NAD(P)-binding protein [Suhomyces tanzawaensis NRRL Y-17324]ODV79801.1 NAD(P)-binding protein [Suhomyces tanzawaensis NRRL Y-17324]
MLKTDQLPYLNPVTDRRVALITGGNSGIGFYTVLELYLHGYVVYIASRSKSRVLKSIKELKREARAIRLQYTAQQLTSERYLGELYFLEIDMVSLQSVLQAVETFNTLENHLNLLINNAGVMSLPYSLTVDKLEIQLQINYVSPFLLTTKLLPLLEKTADAYPNIEPPRIVHLSSIGHQFAIKYFDMNSTFHYQPNVLFTWFRYGLAKTAGIHFMKLLALRNPKILCLSVHPGFVMNTNHFTYWTRLPIIGMVFWCLFQIFGFFFGVSNEEGAYATIKCCLDPRLTLENDNGKYFATGGVELEPSRVARNMDYAARTWIWTVHQLSERGITIPN